MHLPHSHDPLLLRALAAGEQAWRRGDLARAQTLLAAALRRATARGDLAGALSAHQLLGHVAAGAGDRALARRHHRAVLTLSARHTIPLGVASAQHSLGLLAAADGDAPAARRLIADAIAGYEAIGHAAGAAAARANLAHLGELWARAIGGADAPR